MRKKQLVIHIPSDLKEWLREEAAKDDRSVSYVVEKLLQQGRELIQQKEPAP
ncbi:ribbon-helix-helix protein, CopG family [Stenotrophomonas sp. LARHCG68]